MCCEPCHASTESRYQNQTRRNDNNNNNIIIFCLRRIAGDGGGGAAAADVADFFSFAYAQSSTAHTRRELCENTFEIQYFTTSTSTPKKRNTPLGVQIVDCRMFMH